MSEQAIVFGNYDNLVGILNRPRRPAGPDFAVILLTPGMVHNAGPFRLHVQLARALAEGGLASLRFDLSGIGESLAVGASGSSLERAADEVSQAVDWLKQAHGIQRVALCGLCSGADDAIFSALQDRRVVGVFAIDGCGYRTPRYYRQRLISHYLPKLLNPKKWRSVVSRWWRGPEQRPGALQLGTDVREFPERATAERQLGSLLDRGVQLHFHYTGGIGEYYNYAEQFSDMFPTLVNRSGLTTSFQPASDHVALLCEHRRELVDLACLTLRGMAQDLASPEATMLPMLPSSGWTVEPTICAH